MVNKNEILDGQESVENQKETKLDFDYKTPIYEYIEQSIKGDLGYFKDKDNFVDDFYRYLKSIGKENDIDNFKEKFDNKIEVKKHLKKIINEEAIPIYDLLYKLETVYFKNFELDNNQNKKLIELLNKKDLSFLYGLIRSENNRNKFLVKDGILTKDELEIKLDGITKSDEKILAKIFGENSSISTNLANPKNKDLLESIFRVVYSNISVNYKDIKIILKSPIFTDDESKKALIKYFLPTISLQNAVESGFITELDLYSELVKIAKKNYGSVNSLIDQNQINDFISGVNRKNIFIETKDLAINIDGITNDIYNSIAEEIKEAKKYIDTVEILGIHDFKNFCKKANLGLDLNNFKERNYITIVTKDTSSKESTYYFYIDKITTTGVELVNVTKKSGISASNQGKNEFKTFQELFNLFEGAVKDPTKTISINPKIDKKFKNGKEVEYNIEGDDVKIIPCIGNKEVNLIPENNDVDTIAKLEIALDEIDPKGSGVKVKDMAFTFKKGAQDSDSVFDESFFYILSTTPNSIKLDNGQTFQGEQLSQFLEAFEMNKCKRFKKLDTADEFFKKMAEKNDKFKDIIFDDGKFVPKDKKGIKDFPGINLFIGDDNESIQINNIENNTVSFSTGKYTEGDKKKNEANTFKSDKNAKNWSYTDFYMYIKNKKLQPKVEKVEEKVEDAHGEHMHKKRNLFTAWMGWLSITEIIKGGESVIHTIKHNLETGNKLKAARAALALGKFLPKHLYVELQSEVENSEKETMEKIKKELTGVDSKVMFPMIIHILENKSSPPYEIEAAMFAVLKYGSLYPKGLAKYRGTYVWFEALGGDKNMIPEYIKRAKENNRDLVVTEEILIVSLLSDQADGKGKIKRRSKIHKEFSATIQEGLSKEAGDGERETGLRMNIDGRVGYIMGEFSGATYANGIGGLENVWKKGPDPAWQMNTIPFVIMAGGISLEIHQSLIDKLKNYAYNTPYTSLIFCSSAEKVKKYNDYVAKTIELYTGSQKSDMYKAFKAIQHPVDKDNKAVAAQKFWDVYGKELYPVINMNDGFVVGKMKKKGNEDLKYYYDEVKSTLTSDGFGAKEDQIDEGFYDQENSPVAVSGAMLSKIKLGDGGTFNSKSGKKVLGMYMDSLKEITYNTNLDEEERFEIFKEMYEKVERDVFDKIQPFIKRGGENGYKDYQIVVAMAKKGFEVLPKEIPKKEDENNDIERRKEYEEFIKKMYNKIKNKTHIPDSEDELSTEKAKVERSIDNILKS